MTRSLERPKSDPNLDQIGFGSRTKSDLGPGPNPPRVNQGQGDKPYLAATIRKRTPFLGPNKVV